MPGTKAKVRRKKLTKVEMPWVEMFVAQIVYHSDNREKVEKALAKLEKLGAEIVR